MLNRKRSGDASNITLNDSLSAESKNSLTKNPKEFELSKFKYVLFEKLTRVVIKRKRSNRVRVLLTPLMQDVLDVVVTLRSRFLNGHNQYIFGLINGLGHIRGHNCLRQYSEECGAAKPKTLCSTKMRKHFATKCQLLNVPNNMLINVALFMGHNLAVHKNMSDAHGCYSFYIFIFYGH